LNRVVVIVVLALIVAGCGPKYKLVKQRQAPPDSQTASDCMRECRIQNNTCTYRCSSERGVCLEEQKQRAVADWPNKLELFNAEMQTYHAEKSLYEQETRRINAQKNSLVSTFNTYKYKCQNSIFNRAAYCSQAETARLQLLSVLAENPKEPRKPKKWSLDKLTAEYQESCPQECSCEKSFDTCFESCGGTIETKRICVSGCE
jgi:hypothetical protein